jgi:Tetratricopeptide repeat
METEEAVTLLLTASGVDDTSDKPTRDTAAQVVLTLGWLALAIAQAGALIRQGLCRLEEFCEIYSRHRKELMTERAVQGSGDYQYTVYTTWELSLEIIEEKSDEDGRDAIELEKPTLFLRTKGREWDPHFFRKAVSTLSSYSLVNRDKNHLISIHPLVHSWARDRLCQLEQQRMWTFTATTIAISIDPIYSIENYHFRRALVPHIDSCIPFQKDGIFHLAQLDSQLQHECLEMALNLAIAYGENSRPQKAAELDERIVEARKQLLGKEHPSTLRAMFNLARNYAKAGRHWEPLFLIEKVVKRREHVLGNEDPATLSSMHGLAIVYGNVGRKQEALHLKEVTTNAMKQILGEEHPDTLMSMHNLAWGYSRTGRQKEGLLLTERVMDTMTRTRAEEHPETLASMYNLACEYFGTDQQREGLLLMEKVVRIRSQTLGERHSDAVEAVKALAMMKREPQISDKDKTAPTD